MLKLALGTAQFGLDYGINNLRGKIPPEEAFRILDAAHAGGIDTLDTALVYGDSEKVLGEYLRKHDKKFRVVSKTKGVSKEQILASLNSSLEILGVERLDAYLFHDFDAFAKNPSIWEAMESLKKSGSIGKAGFSLYRPSELGWILDHRIPVNIIQIPFSVLDQRFLPMLQRAKDCGIEIHARSVFLQGLVFKDSESLDRRFSSIGGQLKELRSLSARTGLSLSHLCLGFASGNPIIDRVVIGVDGLAQLEELMSFDDLPNEASAQLSRFQIDDERILLPFLWGEKK